MPVGWLPFSQKFFRANLNLQVWLGHSRSFYIAVDVSISLPNGLPLYESRRERWPHYYRKPAGYIFIDNQTRKAVKRAKYFAAFNLQVVDALDGSEDTRAPGGF
jgi:hypothetical protein